MLNLPKTAELYASDRHGIYIPQYFAESIRRELVSGIDLADLDALELGPDDCEYYWDIWHDVECNCILTNESGVAYGLYQDGDLWLVPVDAEWEEE